MPQFKSKTYKVTDNELGDAVATASETPQHIIDSLIGDDRDFPVLVRPWAEDQIMVLWGDPFDNPTENVSVRTRFGILTLDPEEETGISQEVWDVPIDTPSQFGNYYGFLTGGRMGDSDKLVMGASDGINDYAPVAFNPVTEERYDISGREFYYDFETSGTVLADPVLDYEVPPIGVNADGYDSGSAVSTKVRFGFSNFDRGKYIWADNATEGSIIKLGSYNLSLLSYAVYESDLITGLVNASCTVFVNESDNKRYLIWSTDGPGVDPVQYSNDVTYYGDPVVIDPGDGPPEGEILEGPWTVVWVSDDDNTWQWRYHSTIQRPGLSMTDLRYTWLSDSELTTYVEANGSDPSPSIWKASVDWSARNLSQPYIEGTEWWMAGVAYAWELVAPDQVVKTLCPTLWYSSDNGISWESLLSRSEMPRFGDPVFPDRTGGCSRSIDKWNGKLYWAAHASGAGGLDNTPGMHIYADTELVGTVAYYDSLGFVPPSFNFFSAENAYGEPTLYSCLASADHLQFYQHVIEPNGAWLFEFMPGQSGVSLDVYTYAGTWRNGTIIQRFNNTKVGDIMTAFASAQRVVIPIIHINEYHGVSAYVIDKCSAISDY